MKAVFDNAVRALQTGRAAEAERLCRGLLKKRPNEPALHHLMAAALDMQGRSKEAIPHFRRAPATPEVEMGLAQALQRAGQAAEAVEVYRRVLNGMPMMPEIWSNLGVALESLNQWAEAEAALRQAVALRSGYAQARANLARVLSNKGTAEQAAGRLENALAAYREATTLAPTLREAWSNLGNALQLAGRPAEAADACRQALALDPDYADAHSNLGVALQDLDQLDEAERHYARAIALRPGYGEAHRNLGFALQEMGRTQDAVAEYRRARILMPDDPDTLFNLSTALLRLGENEEGFALYRARFAARDGHPPLYPAPFWRGEDLAGKTLLVWSEQGYGDILQFCRYLPLARGRAARVLFKVPKALERLLTTLPGGVELVLEGQPVPAWDAHIPLLELPVVFGAAPPGPVPYLDAPDSPAWDMRLPKGGPVKVGLVWAGNPAQRNNRQRSMDPTALAPLLAVPGAAFYSLQVGGVEVPDGVTDLAPYLTDFAETAAAVVRLDLVISVCTSVAHLAGALGRPVWTVLTRAADWRWLEDRADTPWYPTMRLFRQTQRGDWDGPVAEIAAALKDLAG